MTNFAWVVISILLLSGAILLASWFAWRVRNYKKHQDAPTFSRGR